MVPPESPGSVARGRWRHRSQTNDHDPHLGDERGHKTRLTNPLTTAPRSSRGAVLFPPHADPTQVRFSDPGSVFWGLLWAGSFCIRAASGSGRGLKALPGASDTFDRKGSELVRASYSANHPASGRTPATGAPAVRLTCGLTFDRGAVRAAHAPSAARKDHVSKPCSPLHESLTVGTPKGTELRSSANECFALSAADSKRWISFSK